MIAVKFWNCLFSVLHLGGLVLIASAVSILASGPGQAVALFLCGEALWAVMLMAIAFAIDYKMRRSPSVRSAAARVVPACILVLICGLIVIGSANLPYLVTARLNGVAITEVTRVARFGAAVAETVIANRIPAAKLAEFLGELAGGRDSPNVRACISFYRRPGQSLANARRHVRILARRFAACTGNSPAAPNKPDQGRSLIRSIVLRDPANGRKFYVVEKDDVSLVIHWLPRGPVLTK